MAGKYQISPISISVSKNVSFGKFYNFSKEPFMESSDFIRKFKNNDWNGIFAICPLYLKHEKLAKGQLKLDDVIMSVSQSKEIVKTTVNGLKGTIKEYVCDGDLQITINCGIVSVDEYGNQIDEYPEQGVKDVLEVLQISDTLEANSPFLTDILGVDKIVITGYSINQETNSNRQFVSISAISDMDYIVKEEI